MYFQDLILTLQRYWADRNCLLIQPYDIEKGAATFNPATFLRALGPEPFSVAWAEPCRRPTDGRYGENPIRMQHYYQFQVILKPSPKDIVEQYFGSLAAIGITPDTHDIRLVHDDWESPTLGAWGLGWEVWVDGMEVTQFTYFQQVGGIDLSPITGEITYGLERLCMFLQGVDSVYDLDYNADLKYGDIFKQNEIQHSRYNFELADIEMHRTMFAQFEKECDRLCQEKAPLPAADYCLKASHAFNLLDARGAISVNERQAYILKVRDLARRASEAWLENRQELGFPLVREQEAKPVIITADAVQASADYLTANPPTQAPLLLELGVEEMPAQVFRSLMEQLPRLFDKFFAPTGLNPEDVTFMVTPRRIAVSVGKINTSQEDRKLILKGPPARIARDADGNWTKAAEGYARKNGLALDELEIRDLDGTDYLYAEREEKGRGAIEVLAEIIPQFFGAIHWYKTMRWGDGQDNFVRPVQWLVALLGKTTIPCTFAGVGSGSMSHGHRFMHPDPLHVPADSEGYKAALRKAFVLVDQDERRETIRQQIQETAAAEGLVWRTDEGLLTEVSYLLEWPKAVLCSFPEEYLEVPDLVLVSEMKGHQKQLALVDADGKLSHKFIGVSNMICEDMSKVREGYQNVLISRFSDAKFFLREDQKRTLESRIEDLGGTIFQARLGTILEKVQRIEALADWIAGQLEMDLTQRAHVSQIARLCKTDLTTLMVYEFPELQGEVGRYYAINEEQPTIVSEGIRDHYLPKGVDDDLPGSDEAAVVALADRLDSLAGIFGIGKAPTSSSDPFALRRACLSSIAILVDRGFNLGVNDLLKKAVDTVAAKLGDANLDDLLKDLLSFYFDRSKRLFAEGERSGIPGPFSRDTIEAVMGASTPWYNFADLVKRLQAMEDFRERDDFADVAGVFKRASNILEPQEGEIDAGLLNVSEEAALLEAVTRSESAIADHLADNDYVGALSEIAPLRQALNAFMEAVMVNDPDAALKANRHKLIQRVVQLVLKIADFSQVQDS